MMISLKLGRNEILILIDLKAKYIKLNFKQLPFIISSLNYSYKMIKNKHDNDSKDRFSPAHQLTLDDTILE